jgi:hypothetical protein
MFAYWAPCPGNRKTTFAADDKLPALEGAPSSLERERNIGQLAPRLRVQGAG